MARVRYQVDEVPQGAWAHAFFPVAGLTPAGQTSVRRFIHGYPGTMREPSPAPRGRGTLSANPEWMPPSDPRVAPDWFAPQLWWQDIYWKGENLAPSASERGIGYLPIRRAAVVPPVTPIGTLGPLGPSRVAMGGRKVGGRRSMKWPRSIIRWPNLSGEYQ